MGPAESSIALTEEVARALAAQGVDLARLGAAWARALPLVTIVPAFGLRALPATGRAVIGLALACAIVPGVAASDAGAAGLLAGLVRGTSVAIATAVPLWAATMAGGVVDAARGAGDLASAPVVEGRPTPLGVPMAILASAIFLAGGGASRAVASLVARGAGAGHPLVAAASDLASGVALAVAIAGPVLAASIVIELAAALVARAASPAQVHALLAPLRAIAVLVILAVSLDRMADAMARSLH
jgi:type III secretory pathway component EscT